MGAAATKKIVRRDPEPRFTDQGINIWKVVSGDPTRHYVAVYQNSEDYGPEYYEYLGYEVEIAREGGPRFLAGRTAKMGEPVTMRGHVLMSCTGERKAEIDKYGPDGATGLEWLDEIDDRILDKKKGFDPGRGLKAPFLSFENETKMDGASV